MSILQNKHKQDLPAEAEVKPGYKKTKLGWIPVEWEVVRLGELGKWKGGGTPSKMNSAFWLNGTIPWVSPKDMKSLIINKTIDYITKESIKKSSTNLIPKDSILIISGICRGLPGSNSKRIIN